MIIHGAMIWIYFLQRNSPPQIQLVSQKEMLIRMSIIVYNLHLKGVNVPNQPSLCQWKRLISHLHMNTFLYLIIQTIPLQNALDLEIIIVDIGLIVSLIILWELRRFRKMMYIQLQSCNQIDWMHDVILVIHMQSILH